MSNSGDISVMNMRDRFGIKLMRDRFGIKLIARWLRVEMEN